MSYSGVLYYALFLIKKTSALVRLMDKRVRERCLHP